LSRIYLDYNATSPFAKKVLDFISGGDLPFANPASIHSSGKSNRKIINETTSFVKDLFSLHDHHLLFHSGATEFINSLFYGLDESWGLAYFPSDHPCVVEAAKLASSKGVTLLELGLDENGDFNQDLVESTIEHFTQKTGKKVLLNYTYVHNETGVIWPLKYALEIKQKTGCYVHVDAVQSVGKIRAYNQVLPQLDYYTYSTHKFGSLKGMGMSFIKPDVPFSPLLRGGSQQSGLRAGTENTLGVYSIQLALEQLREDENFDQALAFKEKLESMLETVLSDKGEIVAANCRYGRSYNTSNFILYNKKADVSLIHFDMNGMDVSSGSACSVGSLTSSPTLVAMGSKYPQNSIRLSWGQESLKIKT
jgi:cysteine desulfurase